MATATFNTAPDNSTDANFRAWGSGLNTALAAVGLVQTANTGQINWTTATHPTVANTVVGYEMWRFNDALQSSAPVFIRIQYCSDVSTTNSPSLLITVGTGTDGAGGLTGQVTNPTNITKGSKNETVSDLSYVCGKDGLLVVAMFLDSVAKPGSEMFFSVERTRDATGAPTVEGAVLLSHTNSSAPTASLLWFAGGSPAKEASLWSFLLPGTATSGAWNGDVVLSPIYTCWGKVRPAGLVAVIYKQPDFVNGELIVASVYGVSHTYRALNRNFSAGFSTGYSGPPSVAILWE